MATVDGLRPVDSARSNNIRAKRARAQSQRSSQAQARLSPAAAPVSQYSAPAQAPQDNRLGQLADALSSLNPKLQDMANQQYKRKEDKQMRNLRFYTEQFMKDKESGAVDATQVKERFPELVPTVAARIAQATGEVEAKRWMNEKIQGILQDDSLRLNTEARQAAIEEIRAEASEMIGDNEFYGTGFLQQLDNSINEYEGAWMRETAGHHQEIQAESFSNQVTQALLNGGDLEEIDNLWKASSSLNNLERKKLVTAAALDQAIATGNERLLDNIPDRFHNAETKAQFAQAREQIENARFTQWSRAKQVEAYQRQEQERGMKQDVLRRMAAGEDINPAEFWQNPEIAAFASNVATWGAVSGVSSTRNAASLRSNIIKGGSTGSFVESFEDDPQFQAFLRSRGEEEADTGTLQDYIAQRTDISPGDRQRLIDEVPKLVEGVNILQDPATSQYFESTVGDDSKVFAQSPLGSAMQTMGINVQGAVRTAYNTTLDQLLQAELAETGNMPAGRKLHELRQLAADAAAKKLEYYQRNATSIMQQNKPTTSKPRASTGHSQEEEGDNTVSWENLD